MYTYLYWLCFSGDGFCLCCIFLWYSLYLLTVWQTLQINAVGPTLLAIGHRACLAQCLLNIAGLAHWIINTIHVITALHMLELACVWWYNRINIPCFGWKVIGKTRFRSHFLVLGVHFACFWTCYIACFWEFEFGPSKSWARRGLGFWMDMIRWTSYSGWSWLIWCWKCWLIKHFFFFPISFCSFINFWVFAAIFFKLFLCRIFRAFYWWGKKSTNIWDFY